MANWATNLNYSGHSGAQAVWNGTPTKVAPTAGEEAQGFVPGDPAIAQKINSVINSTGGVTVTEITSSTTHNFASATKHVRFVVVGGGGGGGQGDASNGGDGGGSGLKIMGEADVNRLGASATITVGTGGAGSTGGGAGGDGVTTSVVANSYRIAAHGGLGGDDSRGGTQSRGWSAGGLGGQSGVSQGTAGGSYGQHTPVTAGDPIFGWLEFQSDWDNNVSGGGGMFNNGNGAVIEDGEAGGAVQAQNGSGGGGGGGAYPADTTLAVVGVNGSVSNGGGAGEGYGGGGGGGGEDAGTVDGGAGADGIVVVIEWS